MIEDMKDLIELLDFLELDYELNSSRPGLQTKMGEHISYNSLDLPSEYFKKLSKQAFSINLVSKNESDDKLDTVYNPTFNIDKFWKKIFQEIIEWSLLHEYLR